MTSAVLSVDPSSTTITSNSPAYCCAPRAASAAGNVAAALRAGMIRFVHANGILARMDLLDRARQQGWYHTLELPGLTTHGTFDMRQYVPRYGLPASLEGKRVLEVGTWDGFWAFEFESAAAPR